MLILKGHLEPITGSHMNAENKTFAFCVYERCFLNTLCSGKWSLSLSKKVKLPEQANHSNWEISTCECVVVWVGVEMHSEVYHMELLSKIQKWESNSYNWNNGNNSCYQPPSVTNAIVSPQIIGFLVLSWSHVSQKSSVPILLGSWVCWQLILSPCF